MSTKKFSIALKLKGRSYEGLLVLGRSIVEGMAAMPVYSGSTPSLASVISHLDLLRDCIAKWGPKGNRGRHVDLLNLQAARDIMREDLNRLAQFATNKTPNNVELWTQARFPIKSPGHKIGVLQAVQNLRQFIAANIRQGTVKLKWNKPLDTRNIIINAYIVMRSDTSSFADAKQAAIVTKTSFIDEKPLAGFGYYWIIPLHSGIRGVMSDICIAWTAPPYGSLLKKNSTKAQKKDIAMQNEQAVQAIEEIKQVSVNKKATVNSIVGKAPPDLKTPG